MEVWKKRAREAEEGSKRARNALSDMEEEVERWKKVVQETDDNAAAKQQALLEEMEELKTNLRNLEVGLWRLALPP